ncbi:MAG TPA: aldo/keto reductase [Candidatus Saccharimonadia bacterium]|nr:aldo/keto reductase [Candidatus Saccharimonadia bacterium]
MRALAVSWQHRGMVDRTRRTLMAGLGVAALAPRLAVAANDTIKRAIPSSGEAIPVIGLGTSGTFDVASDEGSLAPLREVLERFLTLGGRLVDTSPMYGRAETALGALLSKAPPEPKPFVATKVWTRGREAGIAQLEDSERKIGRALDLVQVHNLIDTDTHLDTLDRWKAEGRIRYTGITHYTRGAHDALEQAAEQRKVDFIQVNYSLAEPDADRRLLGFAQDRGIAVLANRPFADGALFDRARGKEVPSWARDELGIASWAQYFLKWIVSHPAVTCAIPATSKAKHLADNLGAGAAPLPDAAQRARMAQDFAALR